MSYEILITYDTGDSFKNEDGLQSTLDGQWSKLEVATENLNRIREHYEYYEAVNGYHFGKKEKEAAKKLIKNAPKQRWYAGDAADCSYSLKLITDEGTEYQCSAFWCGYFERLVGAEIVLPKIKLPKFRA